MTSKQSRRIAELASELGIGSRVDQGIKHVLGKMPINMSASRAEKVIEALEEELEEYQYENGIVDASEIDTL